MQKIEYKERLILRFRFEAGEAFRGVWEDECCVVGEETEKGGGPARSSC